MRPRLLLLLVAVSAALADTVVLNNGDKLTGEVQGLADGKLLLQTSYAGLIRIDWSTVAELNGERPPKAPPLKVAQTAAPSRPAAKPERRFKRNRLDLGTDFADSYQAGDGSTQLGWNVDAKYVGDRRWDGFFDLHWVLDTSSSPNDGLTAQLTVNRYLTKALFLYPYAAVARSAKADPYRAFGQFYGGGAGWAFARQPDRQLYFRVGLVAADSIGTIASPQGALAFHRRQPMDTAAVSFKVTPFSRLELSARAECLESLEAPAQFWVLFDVTAKLALTKAVSLNFRAYNQPDISRSTVFTIRDLKVSSGLGLSF